ncbi:MAG: tryptophan 7-halogenase, partial [Akkermansiaceae bacterium]|nr:tryptophan 7-halogenase [Akkermansiaceae bacterium]
MTRPHGFPAMQVMSRLGMDDSIKSVLVLGGGSAGLIAALTLRRMLPSLKVELVRSQEIGIIGVGEGTTAVFPTHFFDILGIDKAGHSGTLDPMVTGVLVTGLGDATKSVHHLLKSGKQYVCVMH